MHRDLERTLAMITSETAGLDENALDRHPPGKWNAAQILEHLSRTYSSTAYILDRCVEQGRSKARRRTMRDRIGTLVVVELGMFPTGIEAPPATRPAGLPAGEAVASARASLHALGDAVASADARFGSRIPLANHPLLGPFNLRQWCRFHRVHTAHHMKQVRLLRTRAG
jgi:hypothetical protein